MTDDSAAPVPSAPIGPAPTKRQVWFPDTSALVTMGVHEPLRDVVVEALDDKAVVLARAVVVELEDLKKHGHGPVRGWASTALTQLDWLGEPVALDDPVGVKLAIDIQTELTAGRGLRYDAEHWGESAIIALASRAMHFDPLILSDDFDARIVAHNHQVKPVSIHKLLHLLIRRNKLEATTAEGLSKALRTAGRSSDYTAQELTNGKLGRVGEP